MMLTRQAVKASSPLPGHASLSFVENSTWRGFALLAQASAASRTSVESCRGRRMKKEQTVGVKLPSGLVRELELIEEVEQSDRSTTVRRLLASAVQEWKLKHHARQYGEGEVTLARAARDGGVSLWEMMDHARARKVPAQYDLADLQRDLETISAASDSRER